jgi:hypothetical protein
MIDVKRNIRTPLVKDGDRLAAGQVEDRIKTAPEIRSTIQIISAPIIKRGGCIFLFTRYHRVLHDLFFQGQCLTRNTLTSIHDSLYHNGDLLSRQRKQKPASLSDSGNREDIHGRLIPHLLISHPCIDSSLLPRLCGFRNRAEYALG